MAPFDPKRLDDPKFVEELSDVIFNATRSQLIKKISSANVDTDEFREFYLSLTTESDRALAIVSFSYIDDKLTGLITKAMNPNISGGLETLFSSTGPLGTSSSRIKLAAALNWISNKTYRDLEILRKIRNEFAHNAFTTDFNNKRISGYISSLDSSEGKILEFVGGEHDLPLVNTLMNTRIRFHMRSTLTCHAMISELLTAPSAIRLGLPPFVAIHGGYDKLPDPLKQLTFSAASVCSKLLLNAIRQRIPIITKEQDPE